jgi:hypothetical protein
MNEMKLYSEKSWSSYNKEEALNQIQTIESKHQTNTQARENNDDDNNNNNHKNDNIP